MSAGSGPALGVDVGGTFTDVVAIGRDGKLAAAKVLTTPDDPLRGVRRGLGAVLEQARLAPGEVTRVVHGTTLATNVILQRRGARTAFVTTRGFGDLFRLGREARVEEDRYDLHFQPVRPPLDHDLTFEASERMTAGGDALQPLTPQVAREVAEAVATAQPQAVAVCFLHSWANPQHEQVMAAALQSVLPQSYVAVSSQIWPELREFERGMTTLLSAYVGPVMSDYLHRLRGLLSDLGFACPAYIMDSAGGVMSAVEAATRPIFTLESGGAAGVVAAGQVGARAQTHRVLSFDMGGTTAKAGLVKDGRTSITHTFEVSGKGSFGTSRLGSGLPVKTPVVDLAEVGAGGGSIAWIDGTGILRVGPHSAGADPGPVCYGRGGQEPTVTDANLVLGYLDPVGLADDVHLNIAAATTALRTQIADPLGMADAVEAARAVHDIAIASMASAFRIVTVARGEDPRDCTLVAFGGAGPMFAARLATVFGITDVIIPVAAGVGSAAGLLDADLSVERLRSHVLPAQEDAIDDIKSIFHELETDAIDALATDATDIRVQHSIDLRYRGQAHQLTVPVTMEEMQRSGIAAVEARFHDVYRTAYGVALDAAAELVTFRVRVTRPFHQVTGEHAASHLGVGSQAQPGKSGTPPASSVRRATFSSSSGYVDVPVWKRTSLEAGHVVAGPALIDGADCTVVIPPEVTARVQPTGDIVLRVPGGPSAATV